MRALGARGLLSLLYHGPKVLDAVETALSLGMLPVLDAGPVTLGHLAREFGVLPGRLYKFLDVLESAGLVTRDEPGDDIEQARYASAMPLEAAARAVLGPESIERDRERYPWRTLHGRLGDVLRGEHGIAPEAFEWPPATPEQVRGFETSMAVGMPPIIESMLTALPALGMVPDDATPLRMLDVGGGDGTLALALIERFGGLRCDVFNLPVTAPLVEPKLAQGGGRLGFVGGDFLHEALPSGYGLISFVRVLHDWPNSIARALLAKAFDALPPGGTVLCCEEFRNAERLAIQLFWTYFLMGVDRCTSRLRDVGFYADVLSSLGFIDVRVHSAAFDVIVARKP